MPQSEVVQNKSESVLVPVRLTFKVASSSIGVNQGLPWVTKFLGFYSNYRYWLTISEGLVIWD